MNDDDYRFNPTHPGVGEWQIGAWLSYTSTLRVLLLMAEILHQLIGSFSHYLQGFIHPRWCRISAINSSFGGRQIWSYLYP